MIHVLYVIVVMNYILTCGSLTQFLNQLDNNILTGFAYIQQ